MPFPRTSGRGSLPRSPSAGTPTLRGPTARSSGPCARSSSARPPPRDRRPRPHHVLRRVRLRGRCHRPRALPDDRVPREARGDRARPIRRWHVRRSDRRGSGPLDGPRRRLRESRIGEGRHQVPIARLTGIRCRARRVPSAGTRPTAPGREGEMHLRRRVAVAITACALIFGANLAASFASAGPNPFLDKANGHSTLENGKGIAHPSSGSEVTFDDERALGADVQSGAQSDAPPDATATALGCANRGSATNPRMNQDCTLRRQAEEQITVNPADPTNLVGGQNDSRVGFNKCGFDYSLNTGTTWGDGIPPFYQHLSPIGHTYDAGSDPAVAVDGTGRAWFACVLFDVA